MGKVRVNVAGVTYKNEDGTSRQEILSNMTEQESGVILHFAPTPEHPEAIEVYNSAWRQIGYVPREIAEYILEKEIPVYEIEVVESEFYSWKPTTRKSYGDDDWVDIDGEVYGCKFTMKHPDLEYPEEDDWEEDDWEEDEDDWEADEDEEEIKYDPEEVERALETARRALETVKQEPEKQEKKADKKPGCLIAMMVLVALGIILVAARDMIGNIFG